jgi:hypothetical protein
MSPQRLDEIEHFFVSYNQMEGRQFKPFARRGAEHAQQLLDRMTGGAAGSDGARRSRSKSKK